MRNVLFVCSMLATFALVAFAPTAAADGDEDPPLADCHRVLFLHWIDYSHHYVCVDQDGDIQDGECTVGYKRQAPDGNSEMCLL